MATTVLKFAMVREDYRIEEALMARHGVRRLLTVASGGCTALSLAARRPNLDVTLVDLNPAQLEHVARKLDALANGTRSTLLRRFNVGDDSSDGLNACGAFESLFRSFRRFVEEFIRPADRLQEAFADDAGPELLLHEMTASPYWSAGFAMHFGEPLLLAMFGPDAVQHAHRGSYPAYFQAVIERGLTRRDAADNPYLQQIFLGCTLDRGDARLPYLDAPGPLRPMEMVEGGLAECDDLDRYDLIGLSNIMDWMDHAAIGRLADDLARRMRPGAVLLWRQLNNAKNLEGAFGNRFTFDPDTARSLWERDRSLFYGSLHVGVRKP